MTMRFYQLALDIDAQQSNMSYLLGLLFNRLLKDGSSWVILSPSCTDKLVIGSSEHDALQHMARLLSGAAYPEEYQAAESLVLTHISQIDGPLDAPTEDRWRNMIETLFTSNGDLHVEMRDQAHAIMCVFDPPLDDEQTTVFTSFLAVKGHRSPDRSFHLHSGFRGTYALGYVAPEPSVDAVREALIHAKNHLAVSEQDFAAPQLHSDKTEETKPQSSAVRILKHALHNLKEIHIF